MRTFVDGDGTEWQVWKVVPESRLFLERRGADRRRTAAAVAPEEEQREGVDRRQGDLQEGWLCFGCATERRRLYPVPPEWESCSDERLDLLRRVARKVERVSLDLPFRDG